MVKKIVVLAAFSSAVVLVGLAKPAGADEPADWTLENCVDARGKPTTKLESGARCDLVNRKNKLCLVREGHDDQTDWDFAACTSKPRNFEIRNKAGGAVACGETVAMKLGHEWFRKCLNPQDIGINVCSESRSTPAAMHYDWQLQGCSGQLEVGKPVSLYNVSRKDSVVQAKRPGKIVDTCWSDSMRYGQCTSTRDK